MPRESPSAEPAPVLIGVSTCLLGERVRYDGGHKRDPFVADTLGRFVRFVPVCPELEIGLGTPREPIELVRGGGRSLRLIGTESGIDHGGRMIAYARRRAAALAGLGLSGYILKSGSPSCGLERVPVRACRSFRSRMKLACAIRGSARASSSGSSPIDG